MLSAPLEGLSKRARVLLISSVWAEAKELTDDGPRQADSSTAASFGGVGTSGGRGLRLMRGGVLPDDMVVLM